MNSNTDNNVIKLTFIKDVVGMMRKTADDIEAGHYGDVKMAVFVTGSDKDFTVFGWGDANELELIGLLACAKDTMIGNV